MYVKLQELYVNTYVLRVLGFGNLILTISNIWLEVPFPCLLWKNVLTNKQQLCWHAVLYRPNGRYVTEHSVFLHTL